MERIAVLVASSPTTASAQRAFELARCLSRAGHQVTVGLLEDAVLAGTSANLGLPVDDCAAVVVLTNDLSLRGSGPDSLIPGCRGCTYGDLAELMMAEADRTLDLF